MPFPARPAGSRALGNTVNLREGQEEPSQVTEGTRGGLEGKTNPRVCTLCSQRAARPTVPAAGKAEQALLRARPRVCQQ